MGFDVDLDFDADEASGLDAGYLSQPGWYKAEVVNVEEEDNFFKFSYRVTAGPWIGSLVTDRLWKPESAEDAEKAKKTKQRMGMVLKRLGVYDGTPGSKTVDLLEAVGHGCWLKVEERSYKGKDGAMVKTVSVEYAGVYGLDDERVPLEVRDPKAAGQATSKAARKPTTTPSPSAANGKNYTPPPPPPDYSDL